MRTTWCEIVIAKARRARIALRWRRKSYAQLLPPRVEGHCSEWSFPWMTYHNFQGRWRKLWNDSFRGSVNLKYTVQDDGQNFRITSFSKQTFWNKLSQGDTQNFRITLFSNKKSWNWLFKGDGQNFRINSLFESVFLNLSKVTTQTHTTFSRSRIIKTSSIAQVRCNSEHGARFSLTEGNETQTQHALLFKGIEHPPRGEVRAKASTACAVWLTENNEMQTRHALILERIEHPLMEKVLWKSVHGVCCLTHRR